MDPVVRAQSALEIRDVYLSRTYADIAEDFLPSIHLEDQELTAQARHNVSERVQRAELESSDPSQGVVLIVRYRVHTGIRIVRKGGYRITKSDEESATSDEGSDISETDVCAELSATFVAEYTVTDSTAADNEALSAFAEQNVLYHVWPYWREYAQNMLSRMRLPALMIPMYRPKVITQDTETGPT